MRANAKQRSLVLGLVMWSTLLWSQTEGEVTGTVLDDDGRPLASASVDLERTDAIIVHHAVRLYETDSEGRFVATHIQFGSYAVFVDKPDEGYDTWATSYRNGVAPTVVLSPLSPRQNVVIHLGPKAGSIRLGSVTDAVTGRNLIVYASIRLCRANNTKSCIETSATKKRFLVPSLTEITAEITAPGYKRWTSANQMGSAAHIHLQPDRELAFDVKLEPDGPEPTLSDLLTDLGRNHNKLFTIEEAFSIDDAAGELKTRRLRLPSPEGDLSATLDYMSRTIPHFMYQIDLRNSQIIHVLDSRLLSQPEYALSKTIDDIEFTGPALGLTAAIAAKTVPLVGVQLPGPYEILPVNLRTNISVRKKGASVRDVLSEMSAVAEAQGGGILWEAETELGKNKSTLVKFCCSTQIK